MRTLLLAIVTLMVSSAAHAAQPLDGGPDGFERQLIGCLTNENRGQDCLKSLLSEHARIDNENYLQQVDAAMDFYYRWLAQDRVYAVHPVLHEPRGNVLDARAYLIEDDKGNFLLLEVTLMNMKSNWYLNRFNFNNQQEEVERVLGIEF